MSDVATKSVVHVSCMQWVPLKNAPGRLMLGGSDETELFLDIEVSDEDELCERCHAAIDAHFSPGWIDVRLFHRRGPRLDLRYAVQEIGGNGTVLVGEETQEISAMLDMRTPAAGRTLREYANRRDYT